MAGISCKPAFHHFGHSLRDMSVYYLGQVLPANNTEKAERILFLIKLESDGHGEPNLDGTTVLNTGIVF